MITFELAKKLKDAGWPQVWREGNDFYHPDGTLRTEGCGNSPDWQDFEECYKVPTLSELIEACGDKFRALILTSAGWCADSVYGNDIECGDGSTPEESVANLWLALNPK